MEFDVEKLNEQLEAIRIWFDELIWYQGHGKLLDTRICLEDLMTIEYFVNSAHYHAIIANQVDKRSEANRRGQY